MKIIICSDVNNQENTNSYINRSAAGPLFIFEDSLHKFNQNLNIFELEPNLILTKPKSDTLFSQSYGISHLGLII